MAIFYAPPRRYKSGVPFFLDGIGTRKNRKIKREKERSSGKNHRFNENIYSVHCDRIWRAEFSIIHRAHEWQRPSASVDMPTTFGYYNDCCVFVMAAATVSVVLPLSFKWTERRGQNEEDKNRSDRIIKSTNFVLVLCNSIRKPGTQSSSLILRCRRHAVLITDGLLPQ